MQTATRAPDQRSAAPTTVPAASVAAFRIGFGLLISIAAIRFLANGWVQTLYAEPAHHLRYRSFEWVPIGPAWFLSIELVIIAASGVCIALGYRHRLATGVFLALFIHTELIDAALYLNHYWFLTSTGALLLMLPVHHHWSLDARSGRVIASDRVDRRALWILRVQVGVVYTYAGLAKLNSDWLVRAEPLQLWFADRADVPVLGPFLAIPATAWLASWAAAALDLFAVAFLSNRRTRAVGYTILVCFHVVTGLLFQIGVFPLVMLVAATLFFEPDWPTGIRRRATSVADPPLQSGVGAPGLRPTVALCLLAFAALQVVLPLRHFVIDSNVRWSEEGYLLAWRVMLTEKAGHLEFEIHDPDTGDTWTVGPDAVLTDWQAAAAATRPDLIKATADLLGAELEANGLEPLEIRAHAWVSMNGRPAARLIDPRIDLLAHDRGALPRGWILPMPE